MSAPGKRTRAGRDGLVELLCLSLDPDQASDLVSRAERRLGLDGRSLARGDALLILDELEQTPGLVGVSARFCRTRVLLDWPG